VISVAPKVALALSSLLLSFSESSEESKSFSETCRLNLRSVGMLIVREDVVDSTSDGLI